MTPNREHIVDQTAAECRVEGRTFEDYRAACTCDRDPAFVGVCPIASAPAVYAIAGIKTASDAMPVSSIPDWTRAPLWRLVEHITKSHHASLRRQLPLIEQLMNRLIGVPGTKRWDSMFPLMRVFNRIQFEIEERMKREDNSLFTAIVVLETLSATGAPSYRNPFGSVCSAISRKEHQHTLIASCLDEMRDLTYDYDLPEQACHDIRNLYEELQALENDLRTYFDLEHNILFPRAVLFECEKANVENEPVMLSMRRTGLQNV